MSSVITLRLSAAFNHRTLPIALHHRLSCTSPHSAQEDEDIKAGDLSLCHRFWKLPPAPPGQRGLLSGLKCLFPICFAVSPCWRGSTGLCVCLYQTLGAQPVFGHRCKTDTQGRFVGHSSQEIGCVHGLRLVVK